MENFTVIIPVHNLERPSFLSTAVISILDQSRAPNEVIIVIDGPIGEKLNDTIENLTKKEVIVIRLEKCFGPGSARHAGILRSTNSIIALMDSDDISRSYRFEKQLDILEKENIDIVGGWIEEFNIDEGDLNKLRTTPERHEKIVDISKWRMPVNHVTLVFKKEAYLSIGGYKSMRYAEDFDLITRMLNSGLKFYNIQEVLVDVRVGNEMHNRRRGVRFLICELKVFNQMYSSGYINLWKYICNIIIRVLVRLLPSKIISKLYMKFFREDQSISSN